jgi:hypothetical protein
MIEYDSGTAAESNTGMWIVLSVIAVSVLAAVALGWT